MLMCFCTKTVSSEGSQLGEGKHVTMSDTLRDLVPVLRGALCVQTDLLQDLPDFLVEAHRDSVQGSVQTPPAEPLAVSGILHPRNALRNIQRFYGRQPVPLKQPQTQIKFSVSPGSSGGTASSSTLCGVKLCVDVSVYKTGNSKGHK